ncbi:hypothetical protein ACA910_002295 [Epithemia clementina (nom. ined.)]
MGRFCILPKPTCSTALHRIPKTVNHLNLLHARGEHSEYSYLFIPSGSATKQISSCFCEPTIPVDGWPQDKLSLLLTVDKPIAIWLSFFALQHEASPPLLGDAVLDDDDTVPATPDKHLLSAITPARHVTQTRLKQGSPPSIVLKPIPTSGPEGTTRKVVGQNFDALQSMHEALARELANLNGTTIQQNAAVNSIINILNALAG